ncbi:cell wall / vacuolar inhibitor of fructosidase 2-like [Magnolia sinica]|uniref:cell wall / vacuolar inhibitor of fructosidase 2-like n=1 Tax=Magnolia sinica TaxID=86752 RepID=UPI0026591D80|nr:cell wall / vacuolar inhibitor of fructosidase 2-like [Magnolia sinica]
MRILPISLLVVLLYISQSSASLPIEKDANLIRETCNHTSYHHLCVYSLQSDPRSYTANVSGLAMISIELARANATDTLLYISMLLKKSAGELMNRSLDTCYNEYELAIDRFNEGIEEYHSKEYSDIGQLVVDAAGMAETCEEEFKFYNLKSPLTQRNRLLRQLSNIAADIVWILR